VTERLNADERALLEALWYDGQLVEPRSTRHPGYPPSPCSGTSAGGTKRIRYQGFADKADALKLFDRWSGKGMTPDILDLANDRDPGPTNRLRYYVYVVLSMDDEKAFQAELERRGQRKIFVVAEEDRAPDGTWVSMDSDPKKSDALIDVCEQVTDKIQSFPPRFAGKEEISDAALRWFKSAWKKRLKKSLGKPVSTIRSPIVPVYRSGELKNERILVAVDPRTPKSRPRYLVLTTHGADELVGDVLDKAKRDGTDFKVRGHMFRFFHDEKDRQNAATQALKRRLQR